MTTDRHLALMALMNDIEEPAKTYQRCVRLAAALASNSAQWDAAVEKGNAALDEIELAVRAWTAKHPEQAPTCGRTKDISGNDYPPCVKTPGHRDAYCRSANGSMFLAVAADQPSPA